MIDVDGCQGRRFSVALAPAVQQMQQHGGIKPATESHIPVRSVEQVGQVTIKLAVVQFVLRHGGGIAGRSMTSRRR